MSTMRHPWLGHAWTTPRYVTPRVVSAAWCERAPTRQVRRIVHEFWVLDYARSDLGRGRVGSPRGRWWPRGPRTAHLYRPGTPFWEDDRSVEGTVCEAWVLFSGGEHADLDHFFGKGRPFGRIADPGGRIEAHLHAIALTGQRQGGAGFWRAQGQLAVLFDELRRVEPHGPAEPFILPAAERPDETAEDLVEAARAFFRDHLAERITLARVADHLGMSQSSFSHRYAALAGRPPMADLAAMRIEAATGLLLRGLKLDAIARQVGFCDAFHLSRAFRRHRGVAPSHFRRRFR
ncbi:MAG: helix-turn-helix domain-containing protein [Planctomycetota bacterium]